MASKKRSSRPSRRGPRHGSSRRFPDVEYTLPGGRKEVRPSKPGPRVVTAMIALISALREQYNDDWALRVFGRGHRLDPSDDERPSATPMSRYR